MRLMTRELFLELLKSAPGVTIAKKSIEIADAHELSVAASFIGGSSIFGDVRAIATEATHVALTLADRRHVLVPYENLVYVSSRPPRENEKTRAAGFL